MTPPTDEPVTHDEIDRSVPGDWLVLGAVVALVLAVVWWWVTR